MSKYGMLLNLDRCIGCYACVVACKMCHGTRPGVNYNAVNTVEYGEGDKAQRRYILTMCMHCDNPPCVEVCPVKATYKTDEGPVVIDYDACIGCGACVEACPYDQRYLVVDDETSFEGSVAPYEEESSQRLKVAEKCTFCFDRVKEGMLPMCAIHCPGQCRTFGDVEDPESDISVAIKEKGAINIEGTSIWYVVPEGMDMSLLPKPLAELVAAPAETTAAETTAAATTAAETTAAETTAAAAASAEGSSGLGKNIGVVAVGAAAVVAAGAAATIATKKKKEGTAAKPEDKNGDDKGGAN